MEFINAKDQREISLSILPREEEIIAEHLLKINRSIRKSQFSNWTMTVNDKIVFFTFYLFHSDVNETIIERLVEMLEASEYIVESHELDLGVRLTISW